MKPNTLFLIGISLGIIYLWSSSVTVSAQPQPQAQPQPGSSGKDEGMIPLGPGGIVWKSCADPNADPIMCAPY